MSMKKKTVLLALMLAGVMGLSGCKAWDVVCDVLAVGTTKVEKDNGTKVDLEGKTPEVKDDDSTDLETADSKTTFGNDEKTNDTKRMILKRVTQKTARRTVTRRIKKGNDAFRDTDTGTESYADTDAVCGGKERGKRSHDHLYLSGQCA